MNRTCQTFSFELHGEIIEYNTDYSNHSLLFQILALIQTHAYNYIFTIVTINTYMYTTVSPRRNCSHFFNESLRDMRFSSQMLS